MRRGLRVLLVAATTAGVLVTVRPFSAQSRQPQAIEIVDGHEAAAKEVLVRLRGEAPPSAARRIVAALDADSMVPAGRTGARRLRSRTRDVQALLEMLRRDADVLYAEPNFIVRALTEPADPMFPQLWGLRNVGQSVNGGGAGRPGADIHASDAWDVSLGDAATVVAVVDSGVDYRHPDLVSNMWSAPSAFTVTIGGVTVTCAAGSHGFNARDGSCDPMDDNYHGTHVAGTIAASGNNGLGVVGVNWTASVMGVKFIGADGTGTIADAIAGLEFVVQARHALGAAADVRVLANSWGGRSFSQALRDEIAATEAEDMLFVAAAGNDGLSNDWFPTYPASYDVGSIVAVAASTSADERAWFSNYGARTVHLAAPGVDILSTIPGGGYAFASGTSMAAPHVAGAAALVLSRCDLDTSALKQTMLASVEPVAALASVTATGGRLDVNGAIRSCAGTPAAPSQLTAAAGNATVTLTWSSVAGATGYTVSRALTTGGPYQAIASVGRTGTYTDTSVVNDTTYFYVVSASNPVGESGYSNEASARPKAPSDLMVSALTVPALGGAGLPIEVSATTRNQGAGASLATTTRLYLSRNSLVDASDTVLAALQVAELGAGAQVSGMVSVDLPDQIAPGYYYVIARADAEAVETETQEANNTASRLITIGPDLLVSSVSAPSAVAPGAMMTVGTTVRNQGGGAAGGSVVRFYLSSNTVVDGSDTSLAGGVTVSALAPGASATGAVSLLVPATMPAGSYYLIARADGDEAVAETQESNNTAARTAQVGGDLVVSGLTVPSRAGSGTAITITDTTRNGGAGAIAASVTRFYLSANSVLDASDVLLPGGRSVPALQAGVSSTGSTTTSLPAGLAVGTYYVIAKADGDQLVSESQEANNTLGRSLQVGPDLVVSALTVPYNVRAGAAIAVSDTVLNQGGEGSAASLTRFYLSVNVALDASDVPLDGARAVPPLAASASSAGSTTIVIPADTLPGAYFVIAKADGDGAVGETQESNNTVARAVQVAQ